MQSSLFDSKDSNHEFLCLEYEVKKKKGYLASLGITPGEPSPIDEKALDNLLFEFGQLNALYKKALKWNSNLTERIMAARAEIEINIQYREGLITHSEFRFMLMQWFQRYQGLYKNSRVV